MEVELKLALVDPGDLPRLLAALPAPEAVVEQRNHYLVDPDGVTARERVMVRVREEREGGAAAPARVVATVKRRTEVADGVFRAMEREEDVDPAAWARVLAGEAPATAAVPATAAWLAAELGVTRLAVQGVLANTRTRVPLAGHVLEVDRSRFPGGVVEVEIEVETDDPEGARAVVERAAADAGVGLRAQDLGKYARYLLHLEAARATA